MPDGDRTTRGARGALLELPLPKPRRGRDPSRTVVRVVRARDRPDRGDAMNVEQITQKLRDARDFFSHGLPCKRCSNKLYKCSKEHCHG